MSELDRKRWIELCGGLTSDVALDWYERLAVLYSEPHRHYHNGEHIASCLGEFDSARHVASEPQTIELAIWFHDAIYEPRAGDNEEQSAKLATQFVEQMGVTKESQAAIVELVMATKTHAGFVHRDAPLMVDIDLSIFGQSPERFWEYEDQIRREYDWVPADVFAAKRAEILERFLSRHSIFLTQHFVSKYEAQARANVEESVRRLRKK